MVVVPDNIRKHGRLIPGSGLNRVPDEFEAKCCRDKTKEQRDN